MLVQPYLNFDGRCEEAIEFYRKAVGAEVVMLLRFKDNPDADCGDVNALLDEHIGHVAARIRGLRQLRRCLSRLRVGFLCPSDQVRSQKPRRKRAPLRQARRIDVIGEEAGIRAE